MAVKIDPSSVENLQSLEAVVSGPDGANRLFTITGIAETVIGLVGTDGSQHTQKETFTLLVGPPLTQPQFRKAIAMASLTDFTWAAISGAPNQEAGSSWSVAATDADWDDESQQVELRVDVSVSVIGLNTAAHVTRIGFQVTILAAIAGI